MNKVGRVFLCLFVIAIATFLLFPTIKWYFFTPNSLKQLAAGSNVQIREYSRGQASRDVVLLREEAKSNPSSSVPDEFKYLEKDAKASLEKRGQKAPKDWTLYSLLTSFKDEGAFFDSVESHYRENILSVKNLSGRVLNLGLDLRGGVSVLLEPDIDDFVKNKGYTPSGTELTALLNDDIDILSSRIDQFGVTEPDIRLQGNDQILIEIPGESDTERVNSFLRTSGSLTFNLVNTSLTNQINSEYKAQPSLFFDEMGRIVTPSYIPSDCFVAGYYTNDEYGIEKMDSLVVIYKEVALDGSHLVSANVQEATTQNPSPSIVFSLDTEGGNIFFDFTSKHVGDQLAVVLDGRAKSVATINSAIRDTVQLTGSFTKEEAKSLTVVLKTSALPVALKVMNQTTVGATLGDGSVKIALKALIIGLLLVVLFMIIYYGLSGFIATVALTLNLYIMISLLSALNFTLTLASIAGIVLTLGMAIDANVIIYERMKEEKRLGKEGFEIVKAGFSRAFWTIMDSNITTMIAAGVLIILGSSAVKGFAVTLAIGIGASLFTSLFLSRLIFDFFVTEENGKSVMLSWRKK